MHRRTFVHTLGAAIVASPLAAACAMPRGGATSSSRRLKRVGVQLYSLRDAAKANLDQTFADIAAVGFNDVELLMSNNNFDHSPAQVRAMLDRHGLRAPSTHMGTEQLSDMNRALDEAAILGHQYLFVANVPDEARKSLDGFRGMADRLNRAGEAARKRGVWLGIHNEPEDMIAFDGQVGYDAMIQRTDPSLVRAQLDIGNIAMGGRDPIAYLDKYNDRYFAFHIKDAPSLGSKSDAELGKGIIDVRGVLSRIKNIDDKFLYVEQETYPGAPLDSVKRDYAYISTLEF